MMEQVFKITLTTDGDNNTLRVESSFDNDEILTSVMIIAMDQSAKMRNVFSDAVSNYWENIDLVDTLNEIKDNERN